MEQIIAGQFSTRGNADEVAIQIEKYIERADICIFHNNAPGQHDAYVLGGDEDEDPGAAGAENSAAATAVAGGIAAGAVGALGGTVVALAAAAAGAYTGAFAGAMNGLGEQAEKSKAAERRPGCVMLSVRIADPMNESRVIATLRRLGAVDIERASGIWLNGDWSDFNPVAAPHLVDGTPN